MPAKVGEQEVGGLADIRRQSQDCAEGRRWADRIAQEGSGSGYVTGVDLSAEMIRLAEESERRRPLGCLYVRADAADFRPSEPVDLVVAAYLLNYARLREQLVRLCRVCRDSLRSGGRLVGLSDNPSVPPDGSAGYLKYGFERQCDCVPPRDGDPIRYVFPTADGSSFGFTNYYHSPATYRSAFSEAGFGDFRWVSVSLDPAQAGDSCWDDLMRSPPIVAFSAEP